MAVATAAGLWALYADPPTAPSIIATATPATAPSQITAALAALPARGPARRHDAALLDPTFSGRYTLGTFANSVPLGSTFELLRPTREAAITEPAPVPGEAQIVPTMPAASEIAEDIPLPTPRPAALGLADLGPTDASLPDATPHRRIPLESTPPALAAPPDRPTFFQRLFSRPPASGDVLAYAAPEDGGLGGTFDRSPAYDRWTAVYVISEHTVYLPDGTRLEAHSGLGTRLDDPASVAERMRGATPPNTYELAPREQLFHGVRALRLNPAGDGTTFGRGGLLAHTYMLGPRGDSNGCVVFKNYKAFLQAYDVGEVKRLAVVARLN